MNRTLTIAVITAVAAIMGSSVVAPAIADHGEPIIQLCPILPIATIYDPNSLSCIPPKDCPNKVSSDTGAETHCLLDKDINDDKKVTLCHQSSKSNSSPVTIEVSSKAVEKHLAHGDTLGACYT